MTLINTSPNQINIVLWASSSSPLTGAVPGSAAEWHDRLIILLKVPSAQAGVMDAFIEEGWRVLIFVHVFYTELNWFFFLLDFFQTAGFCTGSVHGELYHQPDIRVSCEMYKLQVEKSIKHTFYWYCFIRSFLKNIELVLNWKTRKQ